MTVIFTPDHGLPQWIIRARQDDRRDPILQRLRKASVNHGEILAPAARDPRGDSPVVALNDHANSLRPPARVPSRDHGPHRSQGRPVLRRLREFDWGGSLRASGRGVAHVAMPRVTPDHLLFILTQGSLRLDLPRLAHLLQSGSVIFVPAGTAFGLLHLGQTDGQVLIVPPRLAEQAGSILPDGLTTGQPTVRQGADIADCMKQLGQITWPVGRSGAGIGIAAQPLNRLALILSHLRDCPPIPENPVRVAQSTRRLVDRFIRLAQREMGQGLTVAELAEQLGTTSAALDRACWFARGRRALDLLHGLQLERAVLLLRAGGGDVGAIAVKIGYSGLSHMKRAFIEATGRPPEDFLPNGVCGSSSGGII